MYSSSSKVVSDITDAEEKFLKLDNFNIVPYLFNNGLFNNIECRKIVSSKNIVEIRSGIYEIIVTKDSKTVKQILETFRNRLHPFQNPGILQRIFSYLEDADIITCKLVCPDWKEIINLKFLSKFNEEYLEHKFLMKMLGKNELITKNKWRNYPYKDKKAALFQMMLAIHPENVDRMLQTLNIGRRVPPDVNNSSNVVCVTENKIDNLIANALKNPTIVGNIFQFLSLEDIKNCRTVCRTWNSVSEPVFRKISKIKFDSNFRPMDFLHVSKYLPYPNLHFKAFTFGSYYEKGKLEPWELCPKEGLSEFLTKFGMNIQSLDLSGLRNIHSFLSHTPNLTELHLLGIRLNCYNAPLLKNDPMIMVPWNVLSFIKILCLRQTVIEVEGCQELARITPVKVHLVEVSFFVGGCYPAEIKLNDYIDFTKVTDVDINVSSNSNQVQQFDWAKDTFVAKRAFFSQTRFVNARKSKTAVDCLKLYHQCLFSEKTCMTIKQIILEDEDGSNSLAALPISLEKLAICPQKSANFDISEPIFLPKLNYLSYGIEDQLNFLSHFGNCTNLTDMEITGTNSIDTRLLPRSIKKLKLEVSSGRLNVLCGVANEHFDLDLLILDYIRASSLNDLKFDIFRPKVLVLAIESSYEEIAFPHFISRNQNMEKIYVQFKNGALPSKFSKSQLSSLVDKESEYYEFVNGRAKAITPAEFFTLRRSLEMKTAMHGFWDKIYKEEEHLESTSDYENNYGGMSVSSEEEPQYDRFDYNDPDAYYDSIWDAQYP